ncbi:asparaginase domain-containing protein [Leucobacter chromiireducens]|uniref:asparaginase n=1 Tax=Leucobacter chromiireducens subsp. solipictus TaxID=398235 RepID=A0ABS1SH29_9MICO|nr:asparaginase [Leucobacter chromiireducens subsp. solipictus]
MANISILGTGGTIASIRNGGDAATAETSAATLVAELRGPHTLRTSEILTTGSYLLNLAELRTIVAAVSAAVSDPASDGVVVTHGTDTMEETAFLAALCAPRRVPVIFTGAQRTADAVSPDGPENLVTALAFAATPELASAGAVISFGGEARSARGTRKSHTTAPSPFGGGTVVATMRGDAVRVEAHPAHTPAPLALNAAFDDARVEIVTAYPGADPAAIDDARARGASAIVLAGTGVGNAGRGFVDRVAAATAAGCPILLSTRVPWGPVVPTYGNGGGIDLVAAGAIPTADLNPFQARILAAVLVSQPDATAPSFPASFAALL